MKNPFVKILVILLFTCSVCMAKNKGKKNPPDSTPAVTAITPGSATGTATLTISNAAPFAVTSTTKIVIDGQPGTLDGIQTGMQVLSQTTPDSSSPEIDLKTAPKGKGKKGKKNSSSSTGE